MAEEKEHSCPNCPDTSAFDKVLETGSPMFHNWARAAKAHATAAHKFDLAAKDYMEKRRNG